MTDTPTLTGQDIGQAERATRAVLEALLAEIGTSFLDWVTLNLLASGGSIVEQGELVHGITGGLKIDERPVLAALDELVTAGLVARTAGDQPRVELTPAGEALHHQVREGINRIADRLYRDFSADDLATAHRVLATVTERANAELAR
jgi:DNA-binding MarR family transcriptional regulator